MKQDGWHSYFRTSAMIRYSGPFIQSRVFIHFCSTGIIVTSAEKARPLLTLNSLRNFGAHRTALKEYSDDLKRCGPELDTPIVIHDGGLKEGDRFPLNSIRQIHIVRPHGSVWNILQFLSLFGVELRLLPRLHAHLRVVAKDGRASRFFFVNDDYVLECDSVCRRFYGDDTVDADF